MNTRGMDVARSVLITLEAYLVFFSASFFSSSLSTGTDKLDGALTLVIRTDPTAEVIERVGSYAQLLAGSPAAIQVRRNEKRDNARYLGDPPSTVLPPLWG